MGLCYDGIFLCIIYKCSYEMAFAARNQTRTKWEGEYDCKRGCTLYLLFLILYAKIVIALYVCARVVWFYEELCFINTHRSLGMRMVKLCNRFKYCPLLFEFCRKVIEWKMSAL